MEITAAPAVVNATNVTVAGGVLAVQLAHAFETGQVGWDEGRRKGW